MSEGLGAFEEHVSYRPGQQIGTMRTLMKWHGKGAKFYIGADTQPRLLDWCTLGDIASCLGAGEIRLAERVTVKKRVPDPVEQTAASGKSVATLTVPPRHEIILPEVTGE